MFRKDEPVKKVKLVDVHGWGKEWINPNLVLSIYIAEEHDGSKRVYIRLSNGATYAVKGKTIKEVCDLLGFEK